jgi:hypothetical protein
VSHDVSGVGGNAGCCRKSHLFNHRERRMADTAEHHALGHGPGSNGFDAGERPLPESSGGREQETMMHSRALGQRTCRPRQMGLLRSQIEPPASAIGQMRKSLILDPWDFAEVVTLGGSSSVFEFLFFCPENDMNERIPCGKRC